jgi:dephospho-CoA kinase
VSRQKISVIGLAGGIASGKSFVAQRFRQLGAAVLDADRVGHEVLREPEVEQAARDRWGAGIFDADGRIDRRRLAQIVFGPSPNAKHELEYLETMTHPRIADRIGKEIERLKQRGEVPAIILDAPVLFEAGWNGVCDKIVYVDAPLRVRTERAQARGWDLAEFTRREAAQESLDAKRELADLVIDNSGSPESTAAQIEQTWHVLASPPSL